MADPLFRLYVSVYEVNKIIHGRVEIWSLSSRVQFHQPFVADQTQHSKINSIPHFHFTYGIEEFTHEIFSYVKLHLKFL